MNSSKDEQRYLSDEAVHLAADLLQRTRAGETREQRRLNRRLAKLVQEPEGMRLLVDLADQVLRIPDSKLAGRALKEVIARRDLQQLGDPLMRFLLRGVQNSAESLSPVLVPMVKSWVRTLSQRLLIDGSYQSLRQHLDDRLEEGFGVNLNWLGELVLGEQEAQKRLQEYKKLLQEPSVDYLSVKISNLCSQLRPLAFDADLERVCSALRELYRASIAAGELRGGEKPSPKFISLDMEEVAFVELTLAAFQRVLSEPEFLDYHAGIGLQAYLPESFTRQQELTNWAAQRVAQGGAPIKIRLVKGAALEWERVHAKQTGWPCPVFEEKLEVDANFKRMIEYGLHPSRAEVAKIGLGSHNLFDLAWAQLVAQENGVQEHLIVEFLEGMANAQAQVVREEFGSLLLYVPAVRREQFSDAMAYLTRRLDENTQQENFLRHIFDLDSGTRPWRRQEEHFRNAVRRRLSVSDAPRRQQLRSREARLFDAQEAFALEPVTDFSLAGNRTWVSQAMANWQPPSQEIPIAIAAQSTSEPSSAEKARVVAEIQAEKNPQDQNQNHQQSQKQSQEAPLYRFKQATEQQVQAALQRATLPSNPWRERRLPERKEILSKAAQLLAKERASLLATLVEDVGKGAEEADAEVSHAIDLANHGLRGLDELPANLVTKPAGAVLIAANWTEPLASSIGGCVTALVGGNSVILRPDSLAVLSSWRAVELLWKAGVPREALQFLPTAEDETGLRLMTDERLARVVFVGQRATAEYFLEQNPHLPLLARTAAQSSMIISACADLDLSIQDLLQSAFAFGGQSEPSCFVALVEKILLEETRFLDKLSDAVESIAVGNARDLSSRVQGLLREPSGELAELLRGNKLSGSQRWLVKPRQIGQNARLWSPGVILGLSVDDGLLKEHLPAPLLAIVEVENFTQGLNIQNAQENAAALGLQSLSQLEAQLFKEQAQAGTLMINRPLNATRVQRQPVGGWKRRVVSSAGPSAQWGGRNFVWQFVDWQETGLPWEVNRLSQRSNRLLNSLASMNQEGFVLEELSQAASSYSFWLAHEFALQHEVGQLQSESNLVGYQAHQKVTWRVLGNLSEDASQRLSLARFALACSCTETELVISASNSHPLLDLLATHEGIELRLESENELKQRIKEQAGQAEAERHSLGSLLRSSQPLSSELLRSLHQADITQKQGPVLAQGRIELLCLHREQLIAETRHRYGHLMEEFSL